MVILIKEPYTWLMIGLDPYLESIQIVVLINRQNRTGLIEITPNFLSQLTSDKVS